MTFSRSRSKGVNFGATDRAADPMAANARSDWTRSSVWSSRALAFLGNFGSAFLSLTSALRPASAVAVSA